MPDPRGPYLGRPGVLASELWVTVSMDSSVGRMRVVTGETATAG